MRECNSCELLYKCEDAVWSEQYGKYISSSRPPLDRAGIAFPILNNLTPTTESCTMKVLEEVGELMQLIGKGQGKSGEPETMTK